jgi:ribonuclease PH
VDQTPLLDLCYEEDVRAEVDFNIVMNGAGEFIEVQGNAEGAPFSRSQLDELLSLAAEGIEKVLILQEKALAQIRS